MKSKINLVELLKDCPCGMELDCTMFDNVTFVRVDDNKKQFPIEIAVGGVRSKYLTKEGCFHDTTLLPEAKCIIFPKGKTTWEGFVPCKFKAGDVLVSENGNIVLLSHIDSENIVHYHCIIPTYGSFRIEENTKVGVGRYYDCVLANEQQRQRMYNKIKCSGHKYNQMTNKLEKLIKPKFKVGDRVKCIHNNNQYDIKELTDTHYTLVEVEYKFKYTESIINDKDWELVPNKFNVTTLKPFESTVLVRDKDTDEWRGHFFSHYDNKSDRPYICIGVEGINEYKQCIPYNGNEHLLGTTNDCDEYYRVWEK